MGLDGHLHTQESTDRAAMPGDCEDDLFRLDVAAGSLDARSETGGGPHADDLAIFDDIHAERRGRTRVAPSNRVVPHGAAAPLQKCTHHRETPRATGIKLGRETSQSTRVEELGIDAGNAHGIAAAGERDHVAIAVRQIDDAARAVHDVVVEIPRERFPCLLYTSRCV